MALIGGVQEGGCSGESETRKSANIICEPGEIMERCRGV
jgi:hypothetical protein